MVATAEFTTDQKQIKNNEEEKKEEKEKSFKTMSTKERLVYIKEVITIEPLICCIVIAKMVCGPAIGNLHFEKACKVNAGFNDTVCEAIVSGTYLKMNFREQNNEVQSYLTQMRSWEVPVSSIVPVLLVLFLGSYSDRHKIRKPFLLIPIFGEMIAIAGTILNIIYMREWPLEMQVVADRVIPSLFGAEKLLIMVSYAYIADISTPEMRIIRMSVIPVLLNICIPVVQALSGILFRSLGYMPVFGLGFFLSTVALVYGIFGVKESRQSKEKDENLISDIFNFQHAIETFKMLVKNKGPQRTNFLCLLVLCYIHTTVNSGEHSAFFLFTQTAYQWTVVDYSYYTTAGTVVNFIGLTVLVPLFAKVLKLRDLTIIAISYLDAILVSTIFVTIRSVIGLYVGRVLSILKAPGHAATRSLLTKCVSKDDMAKALSLTIIVSALAAAVSAQIYHQGIYEHTRKTFPQAFLLFGMGMHLVGIVILIWMYYREKRNAGGVYEINDEEKEIEKEKQMVVPTEAKSAPGYTEQFTSQQKPETQTKENEKCDAQEKEIEKEKQMVVLTEEKSVPGYTEQFTAQQKQEPEKPIKEDEKSDKQETENTKHSTTPQPEAETTEQEIETTKQIVESQTAMTRI